MLSRVRKGPGAQTLCAAGRGCDGYPIGPYKKKTHAVKRGLPSVSKSPGEGLPLADDDIALTVNHVVNIDTGELVDHVHYHILSSIICTQHTTKVSKKQEVFLLTLCNSAVHKRRPAR